MPVLCDGREILRRIFITVRDRHWQEVLPTDADHTVDEARGVITMRARHTSGEVDFEWQGTLQASNDLRTLRFSFQGRALRDMLVCRLGLIVLHPVHELVGAQLTVTGPRGQQRLTVSEDLHPQPSSRAYLGRCLNPSQN